MAIEVPTTARECIEHLERLYEPEDKMIMVVWSINDVIDFAESKGIEITEEKALEVLKSIKKNHDCNMGINWDVISCYL